MSFAGLGILIGSRATTLEGVNGILNFVMMPMWLCSGIFFSYEKFPDWVHPIVQVLPLTSLIDALREVILEGGGLGVAAVPLLIQVAWGAVCLLIAVKIFCWDGCPPRSARAIFLWGPPGTARPAARSEGFRSPSSTVWVFLTSIIRERFFASARRAFSTFASRAFMRRICSLSLISP